MAIYDETTANIILNSEELKASPLNLRTKPRIPTLTTSFNIVLDVLTTAIKQEKEIKNTNCKGRSKTVTVCI